MNRTVRTVQVKFWFMEADSMLHNLPPAPGPIAAREQGEI